ncbi:hypothetical protein H105_01570 [Trichophyton soudanense CBS 452.61]|uniref:Uncharacterized protein n=1 Tax=Trichophyton soudanense CBS 452.61 TaxID=1215331 RepID=A0A022Y2Q5_TRISD|nr:hypothetical protein H105_01570 [Trichophyton soudanense CBS 452.61]
MERGKKKWVAFALLLLQVTLFCVLTVLPVMPTLLDDALILSKSQLDQTSAVGSDERPHMRSQDKRRHPFFNTHFSILTKVVTQVDGNGSPRSVPPSREPFCCQFSKQYSPKPVVSDSESDTAVNLFSHRARAKNDS